MESTENQSQAQKDVAMKYVQMIKKMILDYGGILILWVFVFVITAFLVRIGIQNYQLKN